MMANPLDSSPNDSRLTDESTSKPGPLTPDPSASTQRAIDWSERYLGLAILSTASTAFTWGFDQSLVIHVALATAVAFAALALLHSRRIRARKSGL
jgi:hypothetical protein